MLLGMSLLLALGFALWTVHLSAGLFRRMEWQAGELSRVSWHMLETRRHGAPLFPRIAR